MKTIIALLFMFASFAPLFCYEEPIFHANDVPTGLNYTVKDFYVYNYSETSFIAYARLYYSGSFWREFVNMTASLFKGGIMVGSQKAYIDYMTYGYDGMWPGSESFLYYYLNKTDFDSVFFTVSYSSRDGEPKFNKNAIAVTSTCIEPFYETTKKVSGIVKNLSGTALQFPTVFICVYREDKMILFKKTYADAPNYTLESLQSASFYTYIDLPDQYDSLKYLPNYNVSSTGNIIITDVDAVVFDSSPVSFDLYQNYPNPFNSSTTFTFFIDRIQVIRLELFDITGKSIMMIFNGVMFPGRHSITIDAAMISSGTYFCILSGESQRLSKKITIIK